MDLPHGRLSVLSFLSFSGGILQILFHHINFLHPHPSLHIGTPNHFLLFFNTAVEVVMWSFPFIIYMQYISTWMLGTGFIYLHQTTHFKQVQVEQRNHTTILQWSVPVSNPWCHRTRLMLQRNSIHHILAWCSAVWIVGLFLFLLWHSAWHVVLFFSKVFSGGGQPWSSSLMQHWEVIKEMLHIQSRAKAEDRLQHTKNYFLQGCAELAS